MTVVDPDSVAGVRGPRPELPPSMVERMTLILDAFDGPTTRLTLEEVACRTMLPRSTAHRILDQLVRLEWVDHASFGYGLGRRALGLGGGDGGRSQIRAAAAPLLHELQLRTAMVVHLAVLDGGDCVFLDKVGGRFAASLPSRVGGRDRAYSTAGGKAMLAWVAPEEVDALYRDRFTRCTQDTITDLAALHRELNRIRRRSGLAFERGESVPGVSCVGMAVRGDDGPLASISLCGDARTAQLDRVAPLVAQVARKVSRTLHPDSAAARGQRRILSSNADGAWSFEGSECSRETDSLLNVRSG